MPLDIDKGMVRDSYNDGYCSFNIKTSVRNENRRVVGSKYEEIVRCRFNRKSLTVADIEFLGDIVNKITYKISVPYNARIEMFTEGKLVVEIRGVYYQLEKTDKGSRTLFCYLSTFDVNGGKIKEDIKR